MKVLHLIKTPVGATWAVDQIAELVKAGVEVEAAIPDGPRATDLRALGVPTHDVNTDIASRSPSEIARRIARLRSVVSTAKPDIVHSHFVGTTLLMRLALRRDRRTKRVFQVPGPLHLENPMTARAELALSQPVDSWIATCEWTQNRYQELGIDPRRISLSYYGRDTRMFTGARIGSLRSELGIREGQHLIGMVAYMYPPKRYLGQSTGLKGHEDLISATELLIKAGYDLSVAFVGGAWGDAMWYEHRLRDLARRTLGNRAHFVGTRTDVAEIYPDLDIAVHPSHSENVGGAVESLLSGVPTVTTDVGGFPDLVKNGVTGTTVPPRRPDLLASAIAAILADPNTARQQALAGRALTQELFDIRSTAAQVADLYRLDAT